MVCPCKSDPLIEGFGILRLAYDDCLVPRGLAHLGMPIDCFLQGREHNGFIREDLQVTRDTMSNRFIGDQNDAYPTDPVIYRWAMFEIVCWVEKKRRP